MSNFRLRFESLYIAKTLGQFTPRHNSAIWALSTQGLTEWLLCVCLSGVPLKMQRSSVYDNREALSFSANLNEIFCVLHLTFALF